MRLKGRVLREHTLNSRRLPSTAFSGNDEHATVVSPAVALRQHVNNKPATHLVQNLVAAARNVLAFHKFERVLRFAIGLWKLARDQIQVCDFSWKEDPV